MIRNLLVLRNHLPWPICHLLHKDKGHLELRNNSRATRKFLIAKFDCSIFSEKATKFEKNLRNILTRCYLNVPSFFDDRAEIRAKKNSLIFGIIENTAISFWNFLTFKNVRKHWVIFFKFSWPSQNIFLGTDVILIQMFYIWL